MPSAARSVTVSCLLLAAGLATTAGAGVDSAPGAPPYPGAPGYAHKAIKRQEIGEGARAYWLFEPADPTPPTAPVVVFSHGWLAVNPGPYGAWIEHLVRTGKIVIYPRYQIDWTTRPADFLPNAVAAVRDAFDVLETAPGHVRPEHDRFALIGHSAGGNLAAQMAAVASEFGLPQPRAVVVLMPGEVKSLREPNLARIPPATLFVVIAAEHDLVVGDLRARQIYTGASSIPPSRKKYVFYRTDRHGFPHLVADHLAPTAALALFDTGEGPFRSLQMTEAEVNAFDRHGFWRLADVTLEAGFLGRTLDEATHHGALFTDLGRWSDGQAILSPLVTDDISTVPRVFPSNGIKLIPWQAPVPVRLTRD